MTIVEGFRGDTSGKKKQQKTCLPVQETEEKRVGSLHQEDPLEEGMATHSSILAWRIPWIEEPGGLQSKGSKRVRYNWIDLARMHATLLD